MPPVEHSAQTDAAVAGTSSTGVVVPLEGTMVVEGGKNKDEKGEKATGNGEDEWMPTVDGGDGVVGGNGSGGGNGEAPMEEERVKDKVVGGNGGNSGDLGGDGGVMNGSNLPTEVERVEERAVGDVGSSSVGSSRGGENVIERVVEATPVVSVIVRGESRAIHGSGRRKGD